MKKNLFPIAIIALSLTACKFTINGTVEGEQTGNVYLVTEGKEQMDTLAKAAIVDSIFVLRGRVKTLTTAYLTIEGKKGKIPIFVENTKFTATLNPKNTTENKIEGGDAQKLANQYFTVNNESRKAQAKIAQEYRNAVQAKDTASMEEITEQYNEVNKTAAAKKDSITKANPDSFFVAYMLESKMGKLNAEKLTAQYERLGDAAKASSSGKRIAERIEKLNTLAIGQVAPDFTLNTPDGKPLSMHSIKAKVKVLDFWASWCGPCRLENPNVVKLYEEYNKKGLEILGVSLDRKQEAWEKAIKDDKLTWPQVSDLKGWENKAAKLYDVKGVPYIIVLDENNIIIAKNLCSYALKAKIAEMLK